MKTEELSAISIKNDAESLREWINRHANDHKLEYLLAHAEDGVIWGHFRHGDLVTSGEAFERLPNLRPLTLQQCRLFGEAGEVLLWRTGDGEWRSRLCTDETDSEFVTENQMLWGTRQSIQTQASERLGFTMLVDGLQGLKHAVPLRNIAFSTDRQRLWRPVRLKVHHYLNENDDGLAHICLSRLINVFSVQEGT